MPSGNGGDDAVTVDEVRVARPASASAGPAAPLGARHAGLLEVKNIPMPSIRAPPAQLRLRVARDGGRARRASAAACARPSLNRALLVAVGEALPAGSTLADPRGSRPPDLQQRPRRSGGRHRSSRRRIARRRRRGVRGARVQLQHPGRPQERARLGLASARDRHRCAASRSGWSARRPA